MASVGRRISSVLLRRNFTSTPKSSSSTCPNLLHPYPSKTCEFCTCEMLFLHQSCQTFFHLHKQLITLTKSKTNIRASHMHMLRRIESLRRNTGHPNLTDEITGKLYRRTFEDGRKVCHDKICTLRYSTLQTSMVEGL